MSDINAISSDIARETQDQGEKLEVVYENMNIADSNTERALMNLNQAASKQKKSNKCMVFLVSTVVVSLIIIVVSLVTTVGGGKSGGQNVGEGPHSTGR